MLLLLIVGKLYFLQMFISGSALINETSMTQSAIAVLNYTMEFCGDINWCSIRTGDFSSTSCCGLCECDRKCIYRGDCCPDYEFMRDLKYRGYDNITSFLPAFERYLSWKELNLTARSSSEPGTYYAQEMQCVRAQILPPSKYIIMGQSYLMITKCANIRSTSRSKCEYTSLHDMPSLSFDDVIPVQSTVNGVIYRNKHCAECNNALQPVRRWSASVFCFNEQIPSVYTMFLNNPLTLILEIQAHTKSYVNPTCNIVFEPDHISTRKQHGCLNEDTTYCNDTDDTDISNICKSFTSPVHIINNIDNQIITLKNAACLKCQNESVYEYCKFPLRRRQLAMELNVPKEMTSVDMTRDLNDSLYKGFSDLQFGCKAGEIFDRFSETCRKLYCPRGMFAMNGECEYMFTKVSDGVFQAYLNVTMDTTVNNSDSLSFAKSLYEHIYRYESEFVKINDLCIWSNENTRYIVFIAVSIPNANSIFSNAFYFFGSTLREKIVLKLVSGFVECELTIANSAKRLFRDVIDYGANLRYSVLYPVRWRPNTSNVKFDIRECNFCYRVKLQADEYQTAEAADAVLYKNNNKHSIWDWDITMENRGKKRNIMVCYYHVIDTEPQKAPSVVEESWLGSVGYNIIIPPVLVGLIVVGVMVVLLIRNRRRKQISKQKEDQDVPAASF